MLRTLCTLALIVFTAAVGAAQHRHDSGPGILLLAHGGRAEWNEAVQAIARKLDAHAPVEVAFGMASRSAIQTAVDGLAARGASEIVAIPLFVSSHSSVITSSEYLLGLRAEAPKELAIYARMDHSHGGHGHAGHHAPAEADSDATTPVRTSLKIRMTGALNRHPLVADILLDRARSISRNPSEEVVVLIAHGPVAEEENRRWLEDMKALADRIAARERFHRVDFLTVRDDAPEPIRSQATAELRALVERAIGEGKRVLATPLLISFGGIERGVRKRLEGLEYAMPAQALLPDDRLADWVLDRFHAAIGNDARAGQ